MGLPWFRCVCRGLQNEGLNQRIIRSRGREHASHKIDAFRSPGAEFLFAPLPQCSGERSAVAGFQLFDAADGQMRVEWPGLGQVTERGEAFVQPFFQLLQNGPGPGQSRPNNLRAGGARKTADSLRLQEVRCGSQTGFSDGPGKLIHSAAFDISKKIERQVNLLLARPRHRLGRKAGVHGAGGLGQALLDLCRRKDRHKQSPCFIVRHFGNILPIYC